MYLLALNYPPAIETKRDRTVQQHTPTLMCNDRLIGAGRRGWSWADEVLAARLPELVRDRVHDCVGVWSERASLVDAVYRWERGTRHAHTFGRDKQSTIDYFEDMYRAMAITSVL